jgi:hypothetical protein
MKQDFDLSHYLNVGKETHEKQLEQFQQSESAKLSSTSEQTLHSESMNEEKDKLKAEQSEQEKQQTTPSTQRRISQKQRKENLESYRESFLVPHKIIDRKATYLSRSTWERLEFVVR